NPEVPRNHFRLGPFAGTGRAEKNKPPFHLSPIKKDRDPGNHEHGNTHPKPDQSAAAHGFAARVGSAIKRAPSDPALAQKSVVMPLNQVRLHLPHSIEHDAYND